MIRTGSWVQMICSLVIKISFSFYFPIEFNFRLFRLSLQFTNELRGCHFLVITNLYMILERTIGIIQNPTKIYLISILEVHVFVYFLKKLFFWICTIFLLQVVLFGRKESTLNKIAPFFFHLESYFLGPVKYPCIKARHNQQRVRTTILF